MDNHKKAIEILYEVSNDIDKMKAIIFDIAANHPSILIKTCKPKYPLLKKTIINLLKNDLYIPAVKEWRAVTNDGLAEAKEAVDKIKDELIRKGE